MRPISSFVINRTEYSDACNEYDFYREHILDSCRKLVGNWSCTFCLRGVDFNESKPTVLIIVDNVQNDWEKPFAGSLTVELTTGDFW